MVRKVQVGELEAMIADEQYLVSGTVVICVLTLHSGFKVIGDAGALSPEWFDEDVGRPIARQRAFDQLWKLEGYHRLALAHDMVHIDGGPGEDERAARLAHELNRAWCAFNHDDSQVRWEDAPGWQRASALAGVAFVRANPTAGPEAQHEEWRRVKAADGWTYGPVKDPEAKTHPCMVPWGTLDDQQRFKDVLFGTAVRAVLGLPL